MKLTIIGAGSSYTPEIIDGLLGQPCFGALEVALYDLPEGAARARIICDMALRMAKKRGAQATIEVVPQLDEALRGSDFVVSQFRVGLLAARVLDERIPLKYGLIGQETTGAGGFFKAMRTIPATLALVRRMEAVCPDAWLINFTNPSGIITEAVHRYSAIKCVGLCNVPYNMQVDAARLLGADVDRVYCRMAGLNHLSFVTQVYLDGKPVLPQMIAKKMFTSQIVKNIPKVPGVETLIEKLGMVPSPYLQYYYFEKEMLAREQADAAPGGPGTRGEQILRAQDDLFALYRRPDVCEKPKELEMRGGAYYSTVATTLMKALSGGGPVVTPVNYPNQGAITDLPAQSVVETNCLVDQNGVQPLSFGALPLQVRGLVQRVKAYETLTVEAAGEHSYNKAVLALLNHPLVHGYENAVCLVDDLIAHHGPYVGELR